jgi:hypothetical protein
MLTSIPLLLLVLVVVGVYVVVGRDVARHRSGSAPALLVALFVLFVGERVFGDGENRPFVSGAGLLLLVVSIGLRAWAFTASEGARRESHGKALGWSMVAVGSLLVYAATLPPVTGRLGLDEDGLARWNGALRSLFPILTLLGLVPTFLLDRLLSLHPRVLPAGAARAVQLQGVAAALAVALVFPLNYVAKQREKTWDTAYFKTTAPGGSTLALVNASPDPIEAVLFFPPGNESAREVESYFRDLERQGGGRLTVTRVDQAVDPVRAEALKVRENGNVVLVRGENNQKFKVDLDFDKAKKTLKGFDAQVQKNLMKLTRDQRTVYFLQGHGEASWRENEDPFRRVATFKKDVLEVSNFKVKTWGLTDGSSLRMPDDADVVVIAAPTKPISPEEVDAVKAYWERGGSLFVLVDPTSDPMTDLLASMGVEAGAAPLAHLEYYAMSKKSGGGTADRVNLVTNKFGSHASVKTLSRNAAAAQMAFPLSVAVKKSAEAATKDKLTTLIRTLPMTFPDTNRNFEADPDEAKNVYDLATAVERDVEVDGAKRQARAIVVGSVGWMADVAMRPANAQFGYDAVRWLTRDEDVAGEIESEEDVAVVHTREEDWYWFLTAMFAMPSLVVAVGTLVVRSRRVR